MLKLIELDVVPDNTEDINRYTLARYQPQNKTLNVVLKVSITKIKMYTMFIKYVVYKLIFNFYS